MAIHNHTTYKHKVDKSPGHVYPWFIITPLVLGGLLDVTHGHFLTTIYVNTWCFIVSQWLVCFCFSLLLKKVRVPEIRDSHNSFVKSADQNQSTLQAMSCNKLKDNLVEFTNYISFQAKSSGYYFLICCYNFIKLSGFLVGINHP